nr:hypothetical protein [Chitinophagales bacterium]
VIIEGAVPDFVATDAEEEPKDFFRGFDMGMQFAFGADIYANKQVYFTPQLRMFYGFTDINSQPTRDLYTDYAFSRNAFVGFTVGVHYYVKQ